MKLSLSELRSIIQEEAHAMSGEGESPAAEAQPPEAAPANPQQVEAPEPSDEALAVVEKLGLTSMKEESGSESLGSSFASLLTLVEAKSPGSLDKLSDPVNISKVVQEMGDYMTIAVLSIVNVEVEGMPSRDEFLQSLIKKKA